MGCDKQHENQNNQDVHDMSDYVTALSLGNRLIEPTIRSAIQGLHLRPGSRGLDAGCGIGSHTSLLAEAVSPDGHVTGVDISPELLTHAEEIASKGGLRRQISFQRRDLNKLPFGNDSFDWAWSKDTLWVGPKEMGCPAEDPLPLLNELARVVKPGGIVAVLFLSSQRLLPGYPLLEARLNATYAANAPWSEGVKPRLHFLRTLGWLREANLEECRAHTFVCDVQAPLDQATQKALLIVFQMFWGNAAAEVPPEDWDEFQRLCQPDSPDFILNTPDYYALVTYSLFRGKVPE